MRILFFFLFFICFFSCNNTVEKENDSKSQIEILSQKVNSNPNNILPLLERAKYNLERRKLESALFDLNQCIKIDSLSSECNYLAALCYFEISKYDKSKTDYGNLALICVKNSLLNEKDNFLALALYGEINIAYAKYKEAIDLFNQFYIYDY